MANIGQIVYNLEDYNFRGGYISTTYNGNDIISSQDNSYLNYRINIFNQNLVKVFGSDVSSFSKLGIQAPPGTKVIINKMDENIDNSESKEQSTIMIGRSGVYELDEDIKVTYLCFQRPYKYILDEVTTQLKLQAGKESLEKAEKERALAIEDLNKKYDNIKTSTEYWEEYHIIQKKYQADYEIALNLFNIGVNGVYTLPNPDVPTANENYQDIYNVIIDFIY